MRNHPARLTVVPYHRPTIGDAVFTAKTLKILAVITLVLLAVNAAIGSGRDVLWILDDVLFFALILSVLALVVLTVGTLVKSRSRSRAEHVSMS
jgi:hypothetical protein